MLIHPLSDLHLEITEWGDNRFHPEGGPPKADLVLLAGDTHTRHRGPLWAADRWPNTPVCMIAGNHEYYGGAWGTERTFLRRQAERQGVHFLERNTVDFPEFGIRVAGATLWTDFEINGTDKREASMCEAEHYMNDYRHVRGFSAEKGRKTHLRTVRWLEAEGERAAREGVPLVVMTHHPPVPDSLGNRQVGWDKPSLIKAAYASQRRDLVERVGAALWVCGHTHYSMDIRIGKTRVISNPRGYPAYMEGNLGFDANLLVDPLAHGAESQ